MWYEWIFIQANCYRGIDQYLAKYSDGLVKQKPAKKS